MAILEILPKVFTGKRLNLCNLKRCFKYQEEFPAKPPRSEHEYAERDPYKLRYQWQSDEHPK